MSMSLVRGMSSLNTNPKKKKTNAKQQKALAEHEKWLHKMGVHKSQIESRTDKKAKTINVNVDVAKSNIPSHGTGFAPIQGKKSVFDSAWKKLYDDPEMIKREDAARAKAEEKKSRIGPLYNKGPLQYITDGTDIKEGNGRGRR